MGHTHDWDEEDRLWKARNRRHLEAALEGRSSPHDGPWPGLLATFAFPKVEAERLRWKEQQMRQCRQCLEQAENSSEK